MAQFVDLPIELQTEIFSILSVKHAVNILSISKSTHDQLISSETYWKTQINYYSKLIGNTSSTPEELFNIANVKKQFLELIEIKRMQTESLKMEALKLTYMIRELEMVQLEMNARNEAMVQLGGTINDNARQRMESLKEQTEKCKQQKIAVEEKLNKMKID